MPIAHLTLAKRVYLAYDNEEDRCIYRLENDYNGQGADRHGDNDG